MPEQQTTKGPYKKRKRARIVKGEDEWTTLQESKGKKNYTIIRGFTEE